MAKSSVNNFLLLFTIFLFAFYFLFGCAAPSPKPTEKIKQQFITIGTGGLKGVYYPTGGSICRLVNNGTKQHGIKCGTESTKGSVYNLNAIAAGELEMGMAQSDWHYHAYNGTSKWLYFGANQCLRSVFSVYPEPVTVVARADSGIKKFEDLKGKRINIGNKGSGPRGMMDLIFSVHGLTYDDFEMVGEMKIRDQVKALCDNKVDAIVFTIGHPSGLVFETTTSCNSVLVPVSGPEIDVLVEQTDYYRHATIPGKMYRGTTKDTETFGVGATFVASCKVPEEVVYNVVKSVFENFNTFKKMHPAFRYLKKKEMIKDSLSAPLHDGAKKYYLEAGLM